MKLKVRYASLLLSILLVILGFTWFIAQSVTKGKYLTALALATLLYGCTFLMGKKFRKVFFLLSTIKLIKNENGVASITKIASHIERGNSSNSELAREIIELLIQEGIVERHGDQLLLTGE